MNLPLNHNATFLFLGSSDFYDASKTYLSDYLDDHLTNILLASDSLQITKFTFTLPFKKSIYLSNYSDLSTAMRLLKKLKGFLSSIANDTEAYIIDKKVQGE